MTIETTFLDIALGDRANPRSCPLARAMTRAGFQNVLVHALYVTYNVGDRLVKDMLTQEMIDYRRCFDRLGAAAIQPRKFWWP